MVALILFLILVAILFGVGVAVHWLFILAIIALIIWLIGFAFRPRGGRWFYW